MTIKVPKIDGIRVSTRVLSKICRGVRERLRVGIEGAPIREGSDWVFDEGFDED